MANHSGHRSRVKTEFLARGMEGWGEHRVLELLLFYAIPQGDVNGLAHNLIDRFGSLAGVLDATPEQLRQVPGMGEHSTVLLKLVPAVAQRYVSQRSARGDIISTTEQAIEHLRPYFFAARNEMVYILCMDNKGKLLGIRKVSEGCIDAADINIRRLVEEALALRACRIYLAHNHLSNLALPSGADWSTTSSLHNLLDSVGLELVDHIIFADDDAVSLRESGWPRGGQFYHVI